MYGLSETVAARRKELDISQAKLAEQVGVHQTMISAIERGDKKPTLDLLVRLQEALGVALVPLPSGSAERGAQVVRQ